MNRIPTEIVGDGIPESVRYLREQIRIPSSDIPKCAPIFLLSAGWRSGSTLVQRLICSNPSTMLWGEPFGDHVPICRLAASIKDFGPDNPHAGYAFDGDAAELSKDWIANLNPGLEALYRAHLSFFETLFAKPAIDQGFTRWGIKSVRLSGFHASYLKWLYPNSKIVFLVRHPLSAYRSYRGKRWYTVRPDFPARGIRRFMAHWRYLAESFLDQQEAVGGMLIRYEDLIVSHESVGRLGDHLEMNLDESVLTHNVGARSAKQRNASFVERRICRAMTGSVCRRLGYDSIRPEQSSTNSVGQPVSAMVS